jgi:beta-glucosidase
LKELKGFKRLTLTAGEKRAVIFDVPIDLLAFYDQDLQLILEPGTIQVMVGSSSKDIRLTDSFEIVGSKKRTIAARVFACPVEVK